MSTNTVSHSARTSMTMNAVPIAHLANGLGLLVTKPNGDLKTPSAAAQPKHIRKLNGEAPATL